MARQIKHVSVGFSSSFYKATNDILGLHLEASPNLNSFPKASPPNTM